MSEVSAYPLAGGCDCGEVRYQLECAPLVVHACHCHWCQRESGSAFALNALIESEQLTRLHGEPVMVSTPSASGRGQQIARCPRCHVALWSHYAGSGPLVSFVRVGTLDEPAQLSPDIHIYTASKQPWLILPEDRPAFPEYYDLTQGWPPESLARAAALRPKIEAWAMDSSLASQHQRCSDARPDPTTEIRTEASNIVYQNRWMTVREDRIVRADGSRGLYGVVEKPDFAVIAAYEAGTLHLVQQYRYPLGARVWELPQGSWEGQDIDPLTLAKAELREETGLVAGTMIRVGHLKLASGYSNQGYELYFATDLARRSTELDPEELGLIARPFPLDQIDAMILSGEIQDATTVAALGLLRLKKLL